MRTTIQKLSNLVDKLREKNQALTDVQIVSKALASLPEEMRIIRSTWSSVPVNQRTLDHLLQRLITKESVLTSYKKVTKTKT